MSNIRVVDAMMGRGKTSAAAAYMRATTGEKRFLYITPFLSEVDRICEACDFDQPDEENRSKLSVLKQLLRSKRNIAATHSLFYLLDEKALSLIQSGEYCLIIDEAIDVIQKVNLSYSDARIAADVLVDVDKNGKATFRDPDYHGKFTPLKEMADSGSLYLLDSSFLSVMRPDVLEAFQEVTMMTYLFGGQYQKAYLDYFGLEYNICGIDDSDGFRFTDEPDRPNPINYKELIKIEMDPRMNAIGNAKFSLSKNWYARRGHDNKDIKQLRNNLNTFFRRRNDTVASQRLWTTYVTQASKVVGPSNRFMPSFLQLAARATNAYRDRDHLAYLIDRYADPNILKFFYVRGIHIDADEFALGDMLQWIWRGSIRDNKPIKLYIPSKRMRTLLINWIENVNKGEENNDQEDL